KPHSFHHPSVECIAKRFWNPNQPLNETTHDLVEAYCKVRVNLLVQDFKESMTNYTHKKTKGDFLEDVIEILDKEVDTYLTVSLNRSMSGFIKRLVWVQNSFCNSFN
ncbi:hypothetical protein Gohar_026891, partial [Gossypium harknessii]|nr:hypothetical protein [Gossypium harknessii]